MSIKDIFEEVGVVGTAYAIPLSGGSGIGLLEDELVTPASVAKVHVALATFDLIATGAIDGRERCRTRSTDRTPGPVGMSLMQDDVEISIRDCVVAMLTISDNVATDALIDVVGLERINAIATRAALHNTVITSSIRSLLDDIAQEVGFPSYGDLVNYVPGVRPGPNDEEIKVGIARSRALNPAFGWRTTAKESAQLLVSIWNDTAAAPVACERVRAVMRSQLMQNRIASGFDSSVRVSAKSGGLLGVVRNEIGVAEFSDGPGVAIAVFTRRDPRRIVDSRTVDRAIGDVARSLADGIRS